MALFTTPTDQPVLGEILMRRATVFFPAVDCHFAKFKDILELAKWGEHGTDTTKRTIYQWRFANDNWDHRGVNTDQTYGYLPGQTASPLSLSCIHIPHPKVAGYIPRRY